MRHAIQLDFAGGRRGLSLAGGLLLAVGVVAASVVFLEYHSVAQHRAGLELKLAAPMHWRPLPSKRPRMRASS
jgi:hypothetical protein